MTILTLPLRHVAAKPLRTFLLAAVFAAGVASIVGLRLVSDRIAAGFEKKLISYGANILITPKRETLKISYGGYDLGDVAVEERSIDLRRAVGAVSSIPLHANIAAVAPKMPAAARVNGRSIALVGVDWEQEYALKGHWEVEGTFPSPESRDEVLAGSQAALELGLRPGTKADIGGASRTVSGVLKPTGSDDDSVIFVPLALAQTLAGKPGRAAFLEVAALCSGCPIEEITAQLQAAVPDAEVRALAQVAAGRMYAVHFAQHLALAVSLVILATACGMIVMSMFSAVTERAREIGVMRAVGFSRFSVFTVFASEALWLGLVAGAAGYGTGTLLASRVLERLHVEESVTFDPAVFLTVAAASALVAGLAAAFPARRASLVDPAQALVSL